MKQITILIAILLLNLTANCQKTTVGKDGNFYAEKSTAKAKDNGKPTGKYYFDSKGVKYPVLVTAKGKYFVTKTSKKTGKEYKSYLKLE